MRRDIRPIPIISVTIVTPVKDVVAVVVSISYIMTLTVIVTVDLTLVPILLILALGTPSKTPRLLIYGIGIIHIIAFIIWWWWFRQVVNYIYLFWTQ